MVLWNIIVINKMVNVYKCFTLDGYRYVIAVAISNGYNIYISGHPIPMSCSSMQEAIPYGYRSSNHARLVAKKLFGYSRMDVKTYVYGEIVRHTN